MKALVIPVTPLQQNCTIIWCEKTMKGAVSDPGGDLDQIQKAMEKHKVEVEKIIVTHGHMDHAGGVAELSERLKVPIEGPHKEDLFLIENLSESGAKYGIRDARPFNPTRWLQNDDKIHFGLETLTVRHCPGHTPGHIIFYSATSKLALVGDVLFQGSVGRSDLPQGNYDILIRSIREQLWPLGNDTTFVPGHGPASTFGKERESNPYVADSLFI